MSTNSAQKFDFQNNSKLGVSEASIYLKITPSTLRRLENDGKITSERLANGYRQYSFGDIVSLKRALEEKVLTGKTGREVPQRFEERAVRSGTRNENAVEPRPIKVAVCPSDMTVSQIKSLRWLSYAGLAVCLILALGVVFRFTYGNGNGVIASVAKQYGIIRDKDKLALSPAASQISPNDSLANVLGIQTGSTTYEFHVNIPAVFTESADFKKGLTTTTATAEGVIFTGGAQIQGLKSIDTVTETSLEQALDITGDVVSPTGGGLNAVKVTKINGATLGNVQAKSGNVLMGKGSSWVSQPTTQITTLGTISTGTWEADPIEPGFLTGVWLTNGVIYTFPAAQATAVNQTLLNDGSGTLVWGDLGLVNIADDSLDFDKFKDAMTLDASTDIATAGYNLTISGSGKFGIGVASPSYPLETAGDIYAGGSLRSAGDLYLAGTALSANTTATSGATKVGVYHDSMTYVVSDTNVQSALQTLDSNLAAVSSGAGGIWSRVLATGVISPATVTDKLAIGGSTSSAPFYVSNMGAVTAVTINGNTITSSSGTLTLPAGKTVQFADAFYTSSW